MDKSKLLSSLGIDQLSAGAYGKTEYSSGNNTFSSISPIDNSELAEVKESTQQDYELVVNDAVNQFTTWRSVPAPKRGEIVRQIGNRMRDKREELGRLVTLETGKILAEGIGEIQEAIDIADFAVGLSRQLYGLTMHSERPAHRMYEQWHPLGIVGVISAFNFPAAVWAWNSMLAAVCGDVLLWKPSEQTPLISIAMNKLAAEVAADHGYPAVFNLVISNGPAMGQLMADDRRVPLISATGSCRMGRAVAQNVSKRLGKTILELGGNNAVIIAEDADLDLAIPSTVFGAVGTAGQRCTSTRRILIHKNLSAEFTKRMPMLISKLRCRNPLDAGTLMGPLVNQQTVDIYLKAVDEIPKQEDLSGEVSFEFSFGVLCRTYACSGTKRHAFT
ncbi:MAG: aldehyde dehydrogenase family protein [Bdellovibrionota bacterium]